MFILKADAEMFIVFEVKLTETITNIGHGKILCTFAKQSSSQIGAQRVEQHHLMCSVLKLLKLFCKVKRYVKSGVRAKRALNHQEIMKLLLVIKSCTVERLIKNSNGVRSELPRGGWSSCNV